MPGEDVTGSQAAPPDAVEGGFGWRDDSRCRRRRRRQVDLNTKRGEAKERLAEIPAHDHCVRRRHAQFQALVAVKHPCGEPLGGRSNGHDPRLVVGADTPRADVCERLRRHSHERGGGNHQGTHCPPAPAEEDAAGRCATIRPRAAGVKIAVGSPDCPRGTAGSRRIRPFRARGSAGHL